MSNNSQMRQKNGSEKIAEYEPNTQNINDYGHRELEEASKLFKLVYMIPEETIEGELKLFFNKNSGMVYLCDAGFNAWALNGDKIERFYNCPGCSEEGFLDEIIENHGRSALPECKRNMDDMISFDCKEHLKYLKAEIKPEDAYFRRS